MTRVLVVDDAPFIREIVRHVLEKQEGVSIIGEAIDGQEAVELARTLRPDLILMDIIMPKKSGIEATREILGFLPNVRIIAFSTADQTAMIEKALQAGCCGFLEKPFNGGSLLRALKQAKG